MPIFYKTADNLNGGFQYGQTDGGLPNGAIELTQAEIDAYKLSKVKKTASITIETARKKVQYENVTYKGKTYFATPVAQDNLFKAYFLAKEFNITSLNWLDVNNMQITLILPDALALLKLLYDKIQPLYINEAIAQNTIINATTVAQVEEVLSGGSYIVTPPTNGNSGGLGGDIPPSSNV
ncbi:MAG: DUF4376 domain-containing protein [Proteobacteria bacterium]|nr:DUF4376 domain-containing protein [Pseudomonadota bacterium]NBP16396.1 DUF4376 domain-containing protein [bacterium]